MAGHSGRQGTMEAPKGLLDAISEIDYMHQQEKDGAMLNAGYLFRVILCFICGVLLLHWVGLL